MTPSPMPFSMTLAPRFVESDRYRPIKQLYKWVRLGECPQSFFLDSGLCVFAITVRHSLLLKHTDGRILRRGEIP
jgi:hypothetical protein